MGSVDAVNAVLLFGSALALLGILSSLVAQRFGAPLLLVFLLIGMLAGEDGIVGIPFNDYWVTYLVGSLALAVILFDGGLRTRLSSLRVAFAPSIALATAGVLITAVISGLVAAVALGISWIEGLLVGSVIASTDAAAVFFLMRAGGLQLPRRVGATLEIESGINDPFAVFLTLAFVGLVPVTQLDVTGPLEQVLLLFIAEIVVGTIVGLGGGFVVAALLNRLELPAGLHPLFVVSSAIAVFALAGLLEGSGFLAVYLAGLFVGNRRVRAIAEIVAFHDTATWLCQIVMFFVLGLLVTPSKLVPVILPALAVSFVLMFLARPVAVVLCLAPFRFPPREIAFVSWVGLRGAVSIFLAAIPTLAQIPNADIYFNVAFVVVLVSLLLQGWTLTPLAKALGVALPRTMRQVHRVEIDLPGQLAHELVGYHLTADSPLLEHGGVPRWARPMFVIRDDIVLDPREAGRLKPGDHPYYLAPPLRVAELDALFVPDEETPLRALPSEFPLRADVPLGLVADMYGLEIDDEADRERTIAEAIAVRYEDAPTIGDRLRLGPATLIVRALADDRVARVGLRLEDPPVRSWREKVRRPLRRLLGRGARKEGAAP